MNRFYHSKENAICFDIHSRSTCVIHVSFFSHWRNSILCIILKSTVYDAMRCYVQRVHCNAMQRWFSESWNVHQLDDCLNINLCNSICAHTFPLPSKSYQETIYQPMDKSNLFAQNLSLSIIFDSMYLHLGVCIFGSIRMLTYFNANILWCLVCKVHASGYTIPVKCQGGNAKSYRILATKFTSHIQLKRNRIMRLRGSFFRYIGIQGNLKQPLHIRWQILVVLLLRMNKVKLYDFFSIEKNKKNIHHANES